jgi:hypothetical protein
MAAKLVDIWDTLVTQLQLINGSGVYTHDLSGSSPTRVGRVRLSSPPVEPPFAVVVLDEVPSRHDVVLGKYRRDLVFTIVGWAQSAGDSDELRQEAACNMLDDILRAVESDRTLGGEVYDVLCHGRSFVASEPETGALYGVAVVRAEAYLRVSSGA